MCKSVECAECEKYLLICIASVNITDMHITLIHQPSSAVPVSCALIRRAAVICLAATFYLMFAVQSHATPLEREKVKIFLDVTGFDVAIETIVHSADLAPQMIGVEPDEYGSEWNDIVDVVFDKTQMRNMAVELLRDKLDPAALEYAQAFYESEIGQRLVRAENASHDIRDGVVTREAGTRIVAQMVSNGDSKLETFLRMARAINVDDFAVLSANALQLHFVLSAQDAGLIATNVDESMIRSALKEREPQLRRSIQQGTLANQAYTYQGFSKEDLLIYADALEHPHMQQVYRLLNSVQYEIQASRFELLAYRLAELISGAEL